MLFIYLYHGDLYSDLWKSDLYFRPAVYKCPKRGSPSGNEMLIMDWCQSFGVPSLPS